MTCKVLVVGGGAGGIFSAYMLRELGSSVCVVERKKVWGGKLQGVGPKTAAAAAAAAAAAGGDSGRDADPVSVTERAENAVMGTAGLWIHGSQKSIRCGYGLAIGFRREP
jgi:glycine/D-amino acid oxidase-like deaminating enzyme